MRRHMGSFLAVLLILGLLLLAVTGSPLAIRKTVRDAENYLVEQGVMQSNIVSIEGHYGRRDGVKCYYASVMLADKPQEIIYFTYDLEGHIYRTDHLTDHDAGKPEVGE